MQTGSHNLPCSQVTPKMLPPPRSAYLEKMFHYARILSKPFPFVRVDFYMENDRPLIGEMTFTPKACLNIDMTELGQVELGRLL